jgi:membrane protease YdiL (CAAX protease family)
MQKKLEYAAKQLTIAQIIWYHFYPGILMLLVYVMVGKLFTDNGYPGLSALLVIELLILAPVALGHLRWKAGSWDILQCIPFTQSLRIQGYIKWFLLGFVGAVIVYIPFYPIGIWLKSTVFHWLPPWYFDPGYGSQDLDLIASVYFAGIFIDGIIGPVAEELFFRGYLLPRMGFLKKWAPVVNGTLFGLYHFWQPHNYLAIIAVGIVLSYIVWKTKNVYVGIIVHCAMNIIGALLAYMAASGGILITR